MSYGAALDAQWLNSLPETLGNDFEAYFWNQPDTAKVWFDEEESNNVIAFTTAARKTTRS